MKAWTDVCLKCFIVKEGKEGREIEMTIRRTKRGLERDTGAEREGDSVLYLFYKRRYFR
jgi:hypothetical protein